MQCHLRKVHFFTPLSKRILHNQTAYAQASAVFSNHLLTVRVLNLTDFGYFMGMICSYFVIQLPVQQKRITYHKCFYCIFVAYFTKGKSCTGLQARKRKILASFVQWKRNNAFSSTVSFALLVYCILIFFDEIRLIGSHYVELTVSLSLVMSSEQEQSCQLTKVISAEQVPILFASITYLCIVGARFLFT